MNNHLCVLIILMFILGNAGNTLAGEIMKLSENDSGKTIEITVSDELELVLPENPTTGYVWELQSPAIAILSLSDTHFIANTQSIGAGGIRVMRFHALATGKSVLKLIFHRPFEPNIPPLKTFSVTVLIK